MSTGVPPGLDGGDECLRARSQHSGNRERISDVSSRREPRPPGPRRIPPRDDVPEAVERIVPKRQVQPQRGDVIVRRERVPRLNPYALAAPPWRYRVTVFPDPSEGHVFTSFPHAASAAEQLATERHARVLYIEDDTSTTIADYRE